jgi:cyclin-dependent kinase
VPTNLFPLKLDILIINRILGTPSEEEWPGVTTLPDFKSSFPKWERDMTKPLCDGLDDAGQDLLHDLLVYDPAGRVSAKQACSYDYFRGMHNAANNFSYINDRVTSNGFH